MQGAADGLKKFGQCSIDNDAYRYAMTRNILYRKGKSVETLACFEPDFTMMNEWYKQLFGESEGKDQKGLMPTSCIFSTDLHSMGQFLRTAAVSCSRPTSTSSPSCRTSLLKSWRATSTA